MRTILPSKLKFTDAWLVEPTKTILETELFGAPAAASGGNIKVYLSGAWTAKPVKVWNGSSWVAKPVKTWNGSSWVATTY